MDYGKLRGRIVEKYGTQDKFARALGLSYTSLNLRLNGRVDWKSEEMCLACDLLGVPLEDAHLYFFTKAV